MISPDSRWPISGPETDALLEHRLPGDELGRRRIKSEALSILSQCPLPGLPNRRETGLGVGYVQSGKTLAYTVLSSQARESGYPLIIVMTGTSVPLFEQSTNELKTTLQHAAGRAWLFLENPGIADLSVLQSTLDAWRETDPHLPRQTAMLTVLKHAGRLDNLTALLDHLQLNGITALVIDDEADQASLNTRARQDEISATYRSIRDLRDALWSHAFVQFTATPQALLLISIVDQLSPRFVKVLNPGSAYVGGRDFFANTKSQYVGIIPPDDIPGPQNEFAGAPESLLDALARFFIGVADAYNHRQTEGDDNRSMMIHPSRLVEDHADYYEWVAEVKQEWHRILGSGSTYERDALLSRLQRAHTDILQTQSELSAFAELAPKLGFAMGQTLVHRVNAANGRTPTINWRNRYAHILVGGQVMDRGFVVRGLTVTYMPRGMGIGNADTLQQRARFFGYKNDIKGYCRIYLEETVRDALVAYVIHEEAVRASLKDLETTGTPVTAWRRRFVLSPLMNLTRSNILGSPVVRVKSATAGWAWAHFAYITDDTVKDNRTVVTDFLRDKKPSDKLHGHDKYARIPLQEVRDTLIADYRTATPTDSVRFAAVRERLDSIITASPNAVVDVFFMNHREFRSATEGKGIDQIFQGRGRTTDYPGDRKICTPDRITVQIHEIDVKIEGKVIATKVPVLAIRFPEIYDGDTVLQPGNQARS